mgnify:CR=1 FL=1
MSGSQDRQIIAPLLTRFKGIETMRIWQKVRYTKRRYWPDLRGLKQLWNSHSIHDARRLLTRFKGIETGQNKKAPTPGASLLTRFKGIETGDARK